MSGRPAHLLLTVASGLCLFQWQIQLCSCLAATAENSPSGASRGSASVNEFTRIYLKSREQSSRPEALLRAAAEEESAGQNLSACAKYLAAAYDALASGNVKVSKPIIDKITVIGAKLDQSSKRSLIAALIESADFTQKQSRNLTSDYLLSAALLLKEQTAEIDSQLIDVLVRLASARTLESQYLPAETIYRRAINLLESGKVNDEPVLLQCLSALATLSSQRGVYADAAAILQKVMSRIEKSGKPPSMDQCQYFVQMSYVQRRLGKLDEAKARMNTALDLVTKFMAAPPPSFDKQRLVALSDAFLASVRSVTGSGRADEQVEKVIKTAIQLKVLAAAPIDDDTERELTEICHYFERIGKVGQAADLYGLILKGGSIDEEVRQQLRDAYLDALRAANRTAEAARIEAEMNRQDEAKWKDAEANAEKTLSAARKNKENLAQCIAPLVQLAKVRLAANRASESMPLIKELVIVCQKQDRLELDDNTIILLWDYVKAYLNGAPASKSGKPVAPNTEVQFLLDIANLDEKTAAQRSDLGRITDLSQITNILIKQERYADAAQLMQYVIGLRKKYRPKDLVAASHGYELLADVYRASGDRDKFKEAHQQFLNIMEARYAHSDPRTIRPRLVVVVLKLQEGKLDEAQAVMNQVISTLESATEEPAGTQRADILIQLRKLIGMYLASYQTAEADRMLQKAMTLSRGGEPVWVSIYRERMIDQYCRSAEYEKAEDLCKLRIATLGKSQPEEVAKAHTRLSEVYLFHANYLQKQDRAAESKRYLAQSEQEIGTVVSLLQRTSGNNGVSVKAAQRRHAGLLEMAALSSPRNTRELSLDTRHHLADVPNQMVPSPREPLSFAVFGRSEVVLSGNATTWACPSDIDAFTILDSGGDIGSFGKIKLKDDSNAHGQLMARSVYMLQNNVNLGENTILGNAPRPYPLPPPLSPPAGLKAVRATIKQGVVASPPPGSIIDLGELVLDHNTELTLPHGDYIASKITLLNGSRLTVIDKPPGGGTTSGGATPSVVPTPNTSSGAIPPAKPVAPPAAPVATSAGSVAASSAPRVASGTAPASSRVASSGGGKTTPGMVASRTTVVQQPVPLPSVEGVRFFFRDIPVGADGRQPVQVLLDGGSTINKNGVPSEFQLWYAGTGVMSFKGGSQVNGVIYAPRALVSFAGEKTSVFGSVVGDEVRLSGDARAVFDKDLPSPKALGLQRLVVKPLNNQPVLSQENAGTVMMGIDPDDEELIQGDILVGAGQPAAALDHYIKAATQYPSCMTLTAMARCRLQLKQLPQALADCNKALTMCSDDSFALATRGEIYSQLNQPDQARADFRKALQVLPLPESNTELMAAGISQVGLGEIEKGIELLSECILIRPDYCDAYEYRARAFEKQGRSELATLDRQKLKDVIIAQQKNADKAHQ